MKVLILLKLQSEKGPAERSCQNFLKRWVEVRLSIFRQWSAESDEIYFRSSRLPETLGDVGDSQCDFSLKLRGKHVGEPCRSWCLFAATHIKAQIFTNRRSAVDCSWVGFLWASYIFRKAFINYLANFFFRTMFSWNELVVFSVKLLLIT